MKSKQELRIVFMGTPEFAVESLNALVEGGYRIVGVITMPDKPAGRGHKVRFSPIKQYALSQNITLLQPEKLKDENFLAQLKALKADLQIVVAFRMLPQVVWDMPRYGTFNLHASLLPQYRGAAPINWAIINGEIQTGVTTFFLTHEIDTGKIILQENIPIEPTDNAGTIHDKLMLMGAKLVTKTVDMILDGTAKTISQEHLINENVSLKTAPKLFKENTELKFTMSVSDAHNLVRGLSPYPVAWALLNFSESDKPTVTKIYETEAQQCSHNATIGTVVISKKYAKIALKDGFLHLKVIQTPGKRRMNIVDFLNGLR